MPTAEPRHSGTLTAAQLRAVEALLTEKTVTGAADRAGVNRRTLARWMREPAFTRALAGAQGDALAHAARRAVQLATVAVDVIAGAMADESAPTAVRLRAADVALGRLLELHAMAGLEGRIVALEERHHELAKTN